MEWLLKIIHKFLTGLNLLTALTTIVIMNYKHNNNLKLFSPSINVIILTEVSTRKPLSLLYQLSLQASWLEAGWD